jgi:hypothetical protein
MNSARLVLIAVGLVLAAVLTAGAQSGPADAHAGHTVVAQGGLVELVREVTRPFLDVRAASAAGYAPLLGCVSGQQEGAMGLHLVDGGLVFDDGALEPREPEALMYEMRGGRLRLLGVEYIVPAAAWHAHHAAPPALLGQSFAFVDSPNRFGLDPFYELHVWAWRENPHGTFVDWNPLVSCDEFTQNPQ